MNSFIIEGGISLKGRVTPSGNKNEALPSLMACLLTDDPITLKRVPKIADVMTVCQILSDLGVEIIWDTEDTVTLRANSANSYAPKQYLCSKVRASILLMGPLLSRFSKIRLPLPGGDVIGVRRIDTHWQGMIDLGANLEFSSSIIGSFAPINGDVDIYMDEPSVTATENLLFLSARRPQKTILHNAASEPHVTGLCNLLIKMGVQISGQGTNRLMIQGSENLHGTTHTIGADFMEVGSFLCLGALNDNEITIENVNLEDYRYILKTFSRIGIIPQIKENNFSISGHKPLKINKDVTGIVPTIYSGPWPAFPTDLMSVAIVAASQAEGTAIFFEKMFEGRMFFTDKLLMMGATIILCDPHRVVVNGPSKLRGLPMSSPDVRAGMALLIASLIASGKSKINNIYQIERGYYNIEKKLQNLGAHIKRK